LSAFKIALGVEPAGFFDSSSKYKQRGNVPWEMRNIGKIYDNLSSNAFGLLD
jgi:hypothetical protein